MKPAITLFEAPCPKCNAANDVAVNADDKAGVQCDECREVFEVDSEGRISIPPGESRHTLNGMR